MSKIIESVKKFFQPRVTETTPFSEWLKSLWDYMSQEPFDSLPPKSIERMIEIVSPLGDNFILELSSSWKKNFLALNKSYSYDEVFFAKLLYVLSNPISNETIESILRDINFIPESVIERMIKILLITECKLDYTRVLEISQTKEKTIVFLSSCFKEFNSAMYDVDKIKHSHPLPELIWHDSLIQYQTVEGSFLSEEDVEGNEPTDDFESLKQKIKQLASKTPPKKLEKTKQLINSPTKSPLVKVGKGALKKSSTKNTITCLTMEGKTGKRVEQLFSDSMSEDTDIEEKGPTTSSYNVNSDIDLSEEELSETGKGRTTPCNIPKVQKQNRDIDFPKLTCPKEFQLIPTVDNSKNIMRKGKSSKNSNNQKQIETKEKEYKEQGDEKEGKIYEQRYKVPSDLPLFLEKEPPTGTMCFWMDRSKLITLFISQTMGFKLSSFEKMSYNDAWKWVENNIAIPHFDSIRSYSSDSPKDHPFLNDIKKSIDAGFSSLKVQKENEPDVSNQLKIILDKLIRLDTQLSSAGRIAPDVLVDRPPFSPQVNLAPVAPPETGMVQIVMGRR